MSSASFKLGALPLGHGQTRFTVWAKDRARVDVAVESPGGPSDLPLKRDSDGYYSAVHPVPVGARYKYRLDGGEAFADPASRFQPEGPHGPSQVVDSAAFPWTDSKFGGAVLKGQVLYELHVGAYTAEGTYAALQRELKSLKSLGVTTLELMPLNAFPGKFNWGYDGVGLFAPCAVYGTPDELRALVNEAHAEGLAVILDVVYNHLGPDGNYLAQFAKSYFTDRHPSEWGTPLNFDGEDSRFVREFVLQNTAYWIEEFHLDGLRVDATQNLHDASKRHIVGDIVERARSAAPGKPILLIAESERQDMQLLKLKDADKESGLGVDALWVDDFHHSARVASTGNAEAYCQDYRGTAPELLSCVQRNSLYQGQWYAWQKQPRGNPLRKVPSPRAVFFLQNHDQVANTLRGTRMHALAGESRTRALTTLLLTLPQTPMLFMGQEFFASSPFHFFVDHGDELQKKVNEGRETFLAQFPSAKHAIFTEGYHPCYGAQAFERSKLKLEERETHADALLFHRELLRLRREDPVLSRQDADGILGAALSERVLVLRFLGEGASADRLLLVNLGAQLTFSPCSEPLLAPDPGTIWSLLLSSEETRFGGRGGVYPTGEGPWTVPGECALLLAAKKKV